MVDEMLDLSAALTAIPDRELHGPSAAIDDSEVECSLALAELSTQFRGDGRAESAPVADLRDCAAVVPRAEVELPDALQ